MKQKIFWLWQNAERILIIVFFATFAFNIRKVFLTPYSFLNGGFNEYMTISVSWADVLMIGTIIIYNIKLLISQFSKRGTANVLLENVIRNKSSVIRIYYGLNVSRETIFLLLLLFWTGLSIFWAQFRPIATYRFLILLEIAIFAYISIKSLDSAKWRNLAYYAFITAGLLQSLLGIAQFVHNGSLRVHFLGESILGPNINGVAKIFINGEKHIRAYGTFPHPNILAGFLLIPLFMLLGEIIFRRLLPLYKGEIERGSDTNHQNLTPALSLLRRGSSRDVSYETFLGFIPKWVLSVILVIVGLGFILTFSRSAFLGLFIGLMLLILVGNNKYAVQKLKNGSGYRFATIIVLIVAIVSITLFNKTSFFSSQSLQERNLYQIVSRETILNHSIRGIGVGQFVINAYYAHPNLENWQYQPVHNIFLLIFSELGIAGLVLFLLFAISVFLKAYDCVKDTLGFRLTILLYYCIIISFLVISLFDHYFWDIKIGTIIFVLPLIFLRATMQNQKN